MKINGKDCVFFSELIHFMRQANIHFENLKSNDEQYEKIIIFWKTLDPTVSNIIYNMSSAFVLHVEITFAELYKKYQPDSCFKD